MRCLTNRQSAPLVRQIKTEPWYREPADGNSVAGTTNKEPGGLSIYMTSLGETKTVPTQVMSL